METKGILPIDLLASIRSGETNPSIQPTKTKPYRHQRVIGDYLRAMPNVAVFCDQGTGKTKAVIDFLDARSADEGVERILVIAPNTVVRTWEREVEKHSLYYDGYVHVLRGGSTKVRAILEDDRMGIHVINYEALQALWRYEQFDIANSLQGGIWDIVIADESSKIKHHTSMRAKRLHAFAKLQPDCRRIILTGTPVTHSPLDIFSQYLFLDPSIFGNKWTKFRARYAETVKKPFGPGGRNITIVEGYKNLDELHDMKYRIAVRYTKKECLDLPEKVYSVRTIPWPQKLRKVYDDLKDQYLAEFKDGTKITASNILARLGRLRQVASGFLYGEDGEVLDLKYNPKLEALMEIIEESSGPIIVWVAFTEDIHRIEHALNKAEIVSASIHGDVKLDDRQEIIDRFQDGKTPVLVCQVAAAAHGITLTASDTSVYYSQTMNAEDRWQSEDRSHRIGQKNAVTLIDLEMESSIDGYIAGNLRNKKTLAAAVVEDIHTGNLPGLL